MTTRPYTALEPTRFFHTCEAITRRVTATEWGWQYEPCHQWKGLRTFIDGEGATHYACPALGHMADVVRRFGAAEGEARAMWGNR